MADIAFIERFPNATDFEAYVNEYFDVYPLRWTTGGISGGTCWSESGHYAIESEEEPEMEVLDEILQDVYPNLTYLNFRKMMRLPIIKVENWRESEYYGNYSYGKKKTLDIIELYLALESF